MTVYFCFYCYISSCSVSWEAWSHLRERFGKTIGIQVLILLHDSTLVIIARTTHTLFIDDHMPSGVDASNQLAELAVDFVETRRSSSCYQCPVAWLVIDHHADPLHAITVLCLTPLPPLYENRNLRDLIMHCPNQENESTLNPPFRSSSSTVAPNITAAHTRGCTARCTHKERCVFRRDKRASFFVRVTPFLWYP